MKKDLTYKICLLSFSLSLKATSIENNNKTATISVLDGIVILFINSSTVCNASQVNVQSINSFVINNLYLPDIYWDNSLVKAIENKSTIKPKRKKNITKPIREYGDVYRTPNKLKKCYHFQIIRYIQSNIFFIPIEWWPFGNLPMSLRNCSNCDLYLLLAIY